MTADVAMAKRGYGEMAITGTIAGPIFNILAGLGLGQTLTILKSAKPFDVKINFGLYEYIVADTPGNTSKFSHPCNMVTKCGPVFNAVSVLPLSLLIG